MITTAQKITSGKRNQIKTTCTNLIISLGNFYILILSIYTSILLVSASSESLEYERIVDGRFCEELVLNITNSSSTNDLNTFTEIHGARYSFWLQCSNDYSSISVGNLTNKLEFHEENNGEYNDPQCTSFNCDNTTTITSSFTINRELEEQDDLYAYLVKVAEECGANLLKRCNTFRIGLLSNESKDCPVCGQNDLNCDNVHQCTKSCGQVKSVNYPYNYGNNHRCRWSIRAPNSYYVNLTIIDFDIPSSNNTTKLGTCIFDYLTLIDGYTGKRLGCYCNENLPPTYIVSPWNELIIQFDTNSETTGRGFYFRYEFMKLGLNEKIMNQLKQPVDPNNPTKSNAICLSGWQYFRGSCYKAYNEAEPLQWYDAESKCNAYGEGVDGHLVSILDKDEMLVLLYLLTNVWKSARYKEYYIGLIDVSREGVYRWSDNNPMSYTDWELRPMLLDEETPAQPDGGAYEDCTVIRYNSFSRTSNWHDVPCSLGKHYHSHLEKTVQIGYKWDYVNSYICKTDSISSSSPLKIRRPLFSNEFKPLVHGSHINHLAGSSNSRIATSVLKPQQDTYPNSDSSLNQTNSTQYITSTSLVENPIVSDTNGTVYHLNDVGQKNRFYLSTLDDNRYFVCDNLEVISVVLKCDGIAQCRDGSDESSGCDTDCLDWQFKCANGRCISIGYYCNFVDDCGDGSDEARCERHRCKLNEFKCNSGQCIMAQQRCDLLPDCSDSSDESKSCTLGSNCNSASTFQCYNGYCIPQYAVCDFQIDCPGKFHEDEDVSACEQILKTRSFGYSIDSSAAIDYHSNSPVIFYQANQDVASGWMKQNKLFKCTSGNIIDNNLRCLYEFDRYGYQIGCRDVSHLIDCSDFECPQKDYVKCSSSYCIPWRYICDGKWDCIMGDDEIGCARYVCPGQYKCANQSSCILLHQLCDGHRQCPMGDDEWFCDLQCPSNCDCIGQSVNCRQANLTYLPTNYISRSVRKLDLSYNQLGPNLSNSDFNYYHDLGELILQHNKIEILIPRKFHQLRNLYKLDLSNNQIHSVKRGAFANLRRVTQLLLESNPELINLEPESFLGLSSLQILNISSSRIQAIKKNTFDGLTSLRQLLLRNNMINEIEDGAFRTLTSLVSLDLRGNEIRYFTKLIFTDLKSLRNLSTDSFKFCCLMNHQIQGDRCLPLPDEISDCEDLLSSVPQRTCIWLAGLIACGGNLIVIVWRYRDRLGQKEREEEQVNSTLLLSLGCSDLLMGVYLIIIASVDAWYRGRYIENADNWRQSIGCNVCGLLSTVSSSVSVLTLVFIAYNRYVEICRPFNSPAKFTLGYTYRLVVVLWFVAFTIAAAPLIVWPYFRGEFYARSGVCLAFYITDQKAAGRLYSIVFLPGVNLFAFLLIVYWYIQIYTEISHTIRRNRMEQPNHQFKIILIILVHFVAFSPPIILGFMKLSGYTPPPVVYSWIAVLILPVNSAINPMIYTAPHIRRTIRLLINNYRARKSGAITNASTTSTRGPAINGQAKEMTQMRLTNPDVRQRLAQRNVPPGYMPVKQYIRQADRLNVDNLVEIALGIARDIEDKHRDAVVYSSLGLDDVFVSDKIANVDDSNDRSSPCLSIETSRMSNQQDSLCSTSESKSISVFLSDHFGYRRSQCSHGSGNSNQHSYKHHLRRRSSRNSNCECIDVDRFGDILFKLIQLYNHRKLDQIGQQADDRTPGNSMLGLES